MQTEEGEFAGFSGPSGSGRGFPKKVDLKAKFGDDFVLPKDRSEEQLLNDIANLTALNMAKEGEESTGFSKDILGGLAYDYDIELEALMEEAHSRGFNLHDLDDEAAERLDDWRSKKKKFNGVSKPSQN